MPRFVTTRGLGSQATSAGCAIASVPAALPPLAPARAVVSITVTVSAGRAMVGISANSRTRRSAPVSLCLCAWRMGQYACLALVNGASRRFGLLAGGDSAQRPQVQKFGSLAALSIVLTMLFITVVLVVGILLKVRFCCGLPHRREYHPL